MYALSKMTRLLVVVVAAVVVVVVVVVVVGVINSEVPCECNGLFLHNRGSRKIEM